MLKDFDFIKNRYKSFLFSLVFLTLSVLVILYKGFNFGIDFKGGTVLTYNSEEEYLLNDVRRSLLGVGMGDISLQETKEIHKYLQIRIEDNHLSQKVIIGKVNKALGKNFNLVSSEYIGPTLSKEFIIGSFYAFLLGCLAIFVYVWFRFEWNFSVSLVFALAHDVIISLGAIALFGYEFNAPVLASILTIIGYSLNDTVVIFDQIRENLKGYKKFTVETSLNKAIQQTFKRSINTSLTTLLVVVAIFVFGGPVLQGFALAMIVGIIFGTYSSIFLATPMLLYLGKSNLQSMAKDD